MPRRKGIGGHQSGAMRTDEWLTPPHVLAALGPFDLDPCACSEPRPWPTAITHYAQPQNGLDLPWTGRVWLNPPYGGPSIVGPWLRKMTAHGDGIALIFARTETELFHQTVWRRSARILFLRGRLFFCRRDGAPAANAGAPSCLVAYGERNLESLGACGLPGHLVPC